MRKIEFERFLPAGLPAEAIFETEVVYDRNGMSVRIPAPAPPTDPKPPASPAPPPPTMVECALRTWTTAEFTEFWREYDRLTRKARDAR